MTDRELLELAAKAAGIDGHYVPDYNADYYYRGNTDGILHECPDGRLDVWNPLDDDGDALRLAVKLMEFEPYKGRGYLPIITSDVMKTRRAIVRAAAEIGKVMK